MAMGDKATSFDTTFVGLFWKHLHYLGRESVQNIQQYDEVVIERDGERETLNNDAYYSNLSSSIIKLIPVLGLRNG